jgi:rhamnosyl/mannosyltransferase
MYEVLQINKLYYPWVGGIETVVKDLAEGLVKNGIPVNVLCSQDKGKILEEDINGVKIYRTGSFGIFASMPLLVFLKFLRK